MAVEIKVPTVGESISEVTLVKWLKADGAYAQRDEIIAELESEKATFEINAEQAGAVKHIAKEGDTLQIGDIVCSIDTDAEAPAATEAAAPAAAEKKAEPVAQPAASTSSTDVNATPVAKAIIEDKKVDTKQIQASGSNGKILKQDVLDLLEHPGTKPGTAMFSREERGEKMSNLRKTISRRLVEAKNTTAMLTTFNEVDMGPIMEIRKQYKDKFKEKHGVGLVVPVIRNAESLSMAGVEAAVVELATKAKNNKLTIEEMTGGTFTITNGGIFGSMMSTPIINIPQSAILGMHNIVERPMAVNGQVVIKPMMYVALSYDHRIIDGRESVGFLVTVKNLLENPSLLLFGKDPVQALLEM